jgi:hypothetical protein
MGKTYQLCSSCWYYAALSDIGPCVCTEAARVMRHVLHLFDLIKLAHTLDPALQHEHVCQEDMATVLATCTSFALYPGSVVHISG